MRGVPGSQGKTVLFLGIPPRSLVQAETPEEGIQLPSARAQVASAGASGWQCPPAKRSCCSARWCARSSASRTSWPSTSWQRRYILDKHCSLFTVHCALFRRELGSSTGSWRALSSVAVARGRLRPECKGTLSVCLPVLGGGRAGLSSHGNDPVSRDAQAGVRPAERRHAALAAAHVPEARLLWVHLLQVLKPVLDEQIHCTNLNCTLKI